VKRVELVQRHLVEEPADEIGRRVVPRDIEHQAAPAKARCVFDVQNREVDGVGAGRLGGEQLQQRDGAVEEAARVTGGNDYPLRGYR